MRWSDQQVEAVAIARAGRRVAAVRRALEQLVDLFGGESHVGILSVPDMVPIEAQHQWRVERCRFKDRYRPQRFFLTLDPGEEQSPAALDHRLPISRR